MRLTLVMNISTVLANSLRIPGAIKQHNAPFSAKKTKWLYYETVPIGEHEPGFPFKAGYFRFARNSGVI
jgi:hypothetical protein